MSRYASSAFTRTPFALFYLGLVLAHRSAQRSDCYLLANCRGPRLIVVSVRIGMPKQARRQRAAQQAGPRTTLLDLWRGDLSEVVTAFLPLQSIATVPRISRRFRERHPIVLFALARRHGCANAMNAASLDAIAATGRDWSRFGGGEQEGWLALPPARYSRGTCAITMNAIDDGVRYIELTTTGETNHGGGLVKRFTDSDGLLCVRRVKYRFRFSDSTTHHTHHTAFQDVAFAYCCMAQNEFARTGGVYVSRRDTRYELRCFNFVRDDDGEIPNTVVMRVQPDTWYDVEMSFAWHKDDASWARVTCKNEAGGGCSMDFPCRRRPLRTVKMYNYSAGVACYSAIEVCYSPHTSRDGPFAESDSDEE